MAGLAALVTAAVVAGCALVDQAALRDFGTTTLDADYGGFAGCDVIVEPTPDDKIDVHAYLDGRGIQKMENVRVEVDGRVWVEQIVRVREGSRRPGGRGPAGPLMVVRSPSSGRGGLTSGGTGGRYPSHLPHDPVDHRRILAPADAAVGPELSQASSSSR